MELKRLFEGITIEQVILLANEIPLERKLLLPFSLAKTAANTQCQISDEKIVSIEKTMSLLESGPMIKRLVLNVSTVPTINLSGSPKLVASLRTEAEITLSRILTAIGGSKFLTSEKFVRGLSRGQGTGLYGTGNSL